MLRQGRKAPSPLGIYKYLPDSLCLLQKHKKAYSRLFTNSILGCREGRGGLAWRVGSVEAEIPGSDLSFHQDLVFPVPLAVFPLEALKMSGSVC